MSVNSFFKLIYFKARAVPVHTLHCKNVLAYAFLGESECRECEKC